MATYRSTSRFFGETSDAGSEFADVGIFSAEGGGARGGGGGGGDEYDDEEEEDVGGDRRTRVPRPKRPTPPMPPRPSDFDDEGSANSARSSAPPKRKRAKKQPRVIEAIGPIAEVDLYPPDGESAAAAKREYIPFSEVRRNSVTRNCPCCYWNFGMAVEYKIQPQLYKMRKLYEACKSTYPVDVTAQRVSEYFNDEILPEERSKGTPVTTWSAAVVHAHITECLDDPAIQLKGAVEKCKALESELRDMIFYTSGGKKAYDAKALRDALMVQRHRFSLEKMDASKMKSNLDGDRSGLGMFIVEPPNAKR